MLNRKTLKHINEVKNMADAERSNKINMSIDLRLIIVGLSLIIIGMLAFWRPWQAEATNEDRTVEVTGQATVKAEPDEFSFNPLYQSTATTKQPAIDELNKKSNDIIAKLKEIGLSDKQIKSNVNGYDQLYDRPGTENTVNYTLSLTITVPSREQAQKVQDYLQTTAPQGSVTPLPTFSDAKRKELESQARDEATKDARKKADQSAKNLGFKLGKVKSVNDGSGFDGPTPFEGKGISLAVDSAAATRASFAVQPGENELPYSVTVVYYLK
jgi:uncharacterized protein